MIKKCLGCGSLMQSKDIDEVGYIDPTLINGSFYCQRCFRIKNYNDYLVVNKDNVDYIKILEEINNTNDLVIYLVDIFNINNELLNIRKHLKNKMILVFNKRDILPKSVKDYKLLEYFNKFNLDILDILIISSNKNYMIDRLYNLINKHKTSRNVFVVGNTNAGKSTLINKFIKNYSKEKETIVTSIYRSTTLNMINICINEELSLIDTPGLLDDGNISCYVDSKTLKKIIPKKEIKPITYQINGRTSFLIDNLVRIDYLSNRTNSMTFYLSNELKVEKINHLTNERLNDMKLYSFELDNDQDIVINGLGFIKFVNKCEVDIKTHDNISIYERDNLI